MKQQAWPVTVLASLMMAAGLTACGGGSSSSNAPTLAVPAMSGAGVYAVSVTRGDELLAGKYYSAADGQALVVLNGNNEKAASIYSRESGEKKAWMASGGIASDTAIVFASTTVLNSAAMALGEVAGTYVLLLADQSRAMFTVDASGKVSAGSSSCKISGQFAKASVAQAVKIQLATTGCSGLPVSINGYALQDSDYAPAVLRLVNADSNPSVDLWAFAG
ncbi:hypothetical protein G7047_01375 [Diaphorobacter sp. HDW4A]|uniref:hypothetical protein n=1 Tax=Diaphorobacter sp. HDW4A TaxID=2714924 RepID=UPI00140DC540|nr:hypothetical protein [Diaphorobacter sp. HDW4A]QIL78722.1 hypothetical protein G7047_01375 [Diaphorobacter sp. HDW4A]